jgi:acyl-CoA dehydrogenase
VWESGKADGRRTDVRLTDEQEFIQETIRKFLAKECPREVARDLDARAVFPAELLKQIAALGFCGLNIPEEYGGAGSNLLGSIIVVQELATIAPTLAAAFASATLRGGATLSRFGSEDQKKRFLPAIARGELLFTFATDESRGAVEAIAVDGGQAFVLNGVRKFVSLANQADYVLTPARTGEGLSVFIVDAKPAGLQSKETKKVGFRGSSLCEVMFEHVRIARDNVLGGAGCLNLADQQLPYFAELEEVAIAAFSVGLAQGAYEYAKSYARERVQFGKPIAEFEAVQHMLVDMAIELRASRWLLYHACWLADQCAPFALEAAMAQVHATPLARKASLQCLHILGGYGYMMEYDAQRYVRDALTLLEGCESVEVLKNSVGALLGL